MAGKFLLISGGVLSLIAAVLHLAVIVGGPDWYRFFGAGEAMARMAGEGRLYPTLVTLGIATVLAIWGLYAFSGAGLILRLPLLRTGLLVIAAIYLVRGLGPFAVALAGVARLNTFMTVSSLICLIYGLAYAAGIFLRWPALIPQGVDARPDGP